MLVLPPCDPALHCSGTAAFQRAGPARVGPVATQLQPVLDVGVVVFQSRQAGASAEVCEFGSGGEAEPEPMLPARGQRYVNGTLGMSSRATHHHIGRPAAATTRSTLAPLVIYISMPGS